jgi:hypothetical protein
MSKPITIAMRLWPAILCMLIVIVANRVEYYFMPVVTDFTITELTYVSGGVKLSGYMRETRTCISAGVSAKGLDVKKNDVALAIIFETKKGQAPGQLPKGTLGWGPWSLDIPVNPGVTEVTLSAVHECHIFWATTTKLITFPIIKEVKQPNKGVL